MQVRSQLQQELSLKQEAFLEVERLQGRLSGLEAALSRSTSTTAGSRREVALVQVAHFHTRVQQVFDYKEPFFDTLSFRFCLRAKQIFPHVAGQQAEQQKSFSRYVCEGSVDLAQLALPPAGSFTLTFTVMADNGLKMISHHLILNLFWNNGSNKPLAG